VNARSDDLEGPLAEAGIPYQVRGGSFLERPAVRAVVRLLRRAADESAGEAVRAAAEQAGLLDDISDELGEEGMTFQEDLRRLVVLAAGHDGPAGSFVADLRARFESDGEGRGVQLLPIRQAKTEDAVAEERRLLYVGLTRAKRWLLLSASLDRPRSPFLAELRAHSSAGGPSAGSDPPSPTLNALRAWRRERSKADGVPAYVVFHDSTLAEIAARRPQSRLELAEIAGIGPVKLERYGPEVIDLLLSTGKS
jgi:DNA helicase-2/ATP-dependent DNA helicase PcrA